MNIKIFDSYNIRARLSVYIIIIAPIILTLYVLYEPIRSFTFSVVLIANKLPRCKHSCDSQASTMNCRAGY